MGSRTSSARPAKGWSCRPAIPRPGRMQASARHGREGDRRHRGAAQARPLIDALGLRCRGDELDEDEPHFALTLADLSCPTVRATWCRWARSTGRSWWTGAGATMRRGAGTLRPSRPRPRQRRISRAISRRIRTVFWWGRMDRSAPPASTRDARHRADRRGLHAERAARQGVCPPGGRAAPCRGAGGGRRVRHALRVRGIGGSRPTRRSGSGVSAIGPSSSRNTGSGSVADALQQAPRGVTR
jgi:hypothetical protein